MTDVMQATDIAFPHLGLYLKDVPRGFQIGPIYVALYGVIIALGMIAGISLANAESNRIGKTKDFWWEVALPLMFLSILGARAYYVIFFWDYYGAHPNEILDIRGGGLAIYGGVLTGFFVIFVTCRIKKLNYPEMMDTVVPGLLAGQIIGRWGNFTNREVFGGYTDNLFAMRLPLEAVRSRDVTDELMAHVTGDINYIQVHPTFLYEGALNALLFLVIWLYRRHKRFNGECWLFYIGGYGIIRFFVEGIRTDQLKIGSTNIAVSQVLGLFLFFLALVIEAVVRLRLAKAEKTPEKEQKQELKKEQK